MVGKTLSHYKILELLGAGGMGEVYLGEDTRLGRKVAIKVLPAELAGEAGRLARFEQEARAAAALNHPHIAVVHDVGSVADDDAGQIHFIVQEFLDGDTLRTSLDTGALPLKRVLALAVEVAEAIGAAHAAGIVHRDLKPENIFVTVAGHAKVLDFGLAKLTETAPEQTASASMSPTFLGTVAGQVMGTAGYMAPEQINGQEVDGRADLFAFGCVLYEMTTGRRAFSGANLPETLHKLANLDPEPLANSVPSLPPQLQWIVDKTLAKDPAERYQAAADLGVDLRRLIQEVDRAPGTVSDARRSPATGAGVAAAGTPVPRAAGPPGRVARALPWAIAALAVAVALWAGTQRPQPSTDSTPRFMPLGQVAIVENDPKSLDISPDGTRIVIAERGELLRVFDLTQSATPTRISGTGRADSPTFSPDGSALAFVADGFLKKVRLDGGLPTALAPSTAGGYGVSWEADGTIWFAPDWDYGLKAIDADSGEVIREIRPNLAAGEQSYVYPSLLPGGERVLHTLWDDRWRVVARRVSQPDEVELLLEGYHDARYLPTGHLMFAQGSRLLAATFDEATLAVGEPTVVVDNAVANIGGGWGSFAFSENGALVYFEDPAPGRDLVRIDRDGTRTVLSTARHIYAFLTISPDQRRLLFTLLQPPARANLNMLDFATGAVEPLTTGQRWDAAVGFSPDGERILFYAEDRSGDHFGFRIRPVDGTGLGEPFGPSGVGADTMSWGADEQIVFGTDTIEAGGDTSENIFVLAPGDDAPRVVLNDPSNERLPELSPDGRWLAYVSDRSGRSEVYIVAFPVGDAPRSHQVSRGGGHSPQWSGDGSTIWFANGTQLLAADLLGDGPQTAVPRLFIDGIAEEFGVAADGSFVVTLDIKEPPRLVLIENFFELLRERVPTGR